MEQIIPSASHHINVTRILFSPHYGVVILAKLPYLTLLLGQVCINTPESSAYPEVKLWNVEQHHLSTSESKFSLPMTRRR